jgi:hypothetical protein
MPRGPKGEKRHADTVQNAIAAGATCWAEISRFSFRTSPTATKADIGTFNSPCPYASSECHCSAGAIGKRRVLTDPSAPRIGTNWLVGELISASNEPGQGAITAAA